jgi:hypothetical protein
VGSRVREGMGESIALTTKYVYPLPENHEISEEHAKRALPILNKRLVQAGVRLAWLLYEALRWSKIDSAVNQKGYCEYSSLAFIQQNSFQISRFYRIGSLSATGTLASCASRRHVVKQKVLDN